MNPLFRAAAEVQAFFAERDWRFCIIGGLAVQRWGNPRSTQDVDLTLLTGFGGEELFIDEILGVFRARLGDAREFALKRRVLLIWSSDSVPIDVALGAMPFEESAVARSTPFVIGDGVALLTCSAEDLIVYKAFAGRTQDWADIEAIHDRQGAKLDRAAIWSELRPLLELKEDTTTEGRLRALLGL